MGVGSVFCLFLGPSITENWVFFKLSLSSILENSKEQENKISIFPPQYKQFGWWFYKWKHFTILLFNEGAWPKPALPLWTPQETRSLTITKWATPGDSLWFKFSENCIYFGKVKRSFPHLLDLRRLQAGSRRLHYTAVMCSEWKVSFHSKCPGLSLSKTTPENSCSREGSPRTGFCSSSIMCSVGSTAFRRYYRFPLLWPHWK